LPETGVGRRWADVEFVPLRDAEGLLAVLGRIVVLSQDATPRGPPVPERLAALREQHLLRHRFCNWVGHTPASRLALEQARLASQTRVPVLLVGEPGSGKRWLARTIHQESGVREHGFAALDCAALPGEALAAALFGPGGLTTRPGTGTLLLKEPSRLPRELQELLCGLLSDGAIRVLASTTLDPGNELRTGRLLERLHTCLSTLVIQLPPLRHRGADLPELVERLLSRANEEGGALATGITPQAWDLIRAYAWPRNLHELYLVLQTARRQMKGGPLDAGHLPGWIRQAVQLERTPGRVPERVVRLDHVLEETERRLVQAALRKAQGNKSKAAELLAISRPRLLRRMEMLGIGDGELDTGV
jgi:DNA-binding NtrC family response regulator